MRVNSPRQLRRPGDGLTLCRVGISSEQTSHLLKHGYVLIPGFLSPARLKAANREFLQYFPSSDELAATPQRYGSIFEDPEHLQLEFPFAGNVLNEVSTDPAIIQFVEQLLVTPNVLLSQAAIWAKYAGTGDFDQGLHLDYRGNTLVVPRDDGSFRQVNMILYYTDVDETMGPTCVVSQEKTRDLPLWPTHRPRMSNPKLYKHEKPMIAQAGDLLIFSMRTWHRASDMTADSGARFSHHMVWRAAEHGFQGYHHWPRMGENQDLERFIEKTTPRQREVLGFPSAGDSFWTAETLAAVQLRYPRMDLQPYRAKIAKPHLRTMKR